MNEIRRCRSTWMYCDGDCDKCTFFATSSTTGKQIQGKWLWSLDVRCSNCNYKLQTTGLPTICPNCGAKMDGETK